MGMCAEYSNAIFDIYKGQILQILIKCCNYDLREFLYLSMGRYSVYVLNMIYLVCTSCFVHFMLSVTLTVCLIGYSMKHISTMGL